MLWLAKRFLVFSLLTASGFFVAAILSSVDAPPLLTISSILLVPLILTWPIAKRWNGVPAVETAPVARSRSPAFILMLAIVGILGFLLSISLWSASIPVAIGVFFGFGIVIERLLRTSRFVR